MCQSDKLLPLLTSFNSYLLKIIYSIILIFVCALPWFGKLYKDDLLKHHFYMSLALLLTYLYFALISGVTFWTGPRIVYPAEFSLFILSVIIGRCLFLFYKRKFQLFGI